MEFVKGSKGKHESDIPSADEHSVTDAFIASRTLAMEKITTLPQASEFYLEAELRSFLQELTPQQNKPNNDVLVKVYQLEKQFVIRGELKLANVALNQDEYLLLLTHLAYFLLQQFQFKGDYNALNSGIRMTDSVINKLTQSSVLYDKAQLIELVNLEARLLQEEASGIE